MTLYSTKTLLSKSKIDRKCQNINASYAKEFWDFLPLNADHVDNLSARLASKIIKTNLPKPKLLNLFIRTKKCHVQPVTVYLLLLLCHNPNLIHWIHSGSVHVKIAVTCTQSKAWTIKTILSIWFQLAPRYSLLVHLTVSQRLLHRYLSSGNI
jgi:hypothetical protein